MSPFTRKRQNRSTLEDIMCACVVDSSTTGGRASRIDLIIPYFAKTCRSVDWCIGGEKKSARNARRKNVRLAFWRTQMSNWETCRLDTLALRSRSLLSRAPTATSKGSRRKEKVDRYYVLKTMTLWRTKKLSDVDDVRRAVESNVLRESIMSVEDADASKWSNSSNEQYLTITQNYNHCECIESSCSINLVRKEVTENDL